MCSCTVSRFTLLLLIAATPLAGCAQPTDPLVHTESDSLAALEWVAGVWAGPVVRHYDPGVWQAVFEADPSTGTFTARYVRLNDPALTCEGSASVREVSGPQSILFEQDLVNDECLAFDDGGLIHEFAAFSLSTHDSWASSDSVSVQVWLESGRLEASGIWVRQGR